MSPRDADAAAAGQGARPGETRGPRILMTPDYRRDNPYQQLLADALEAEGARVAFPRGYRRGLPLRRMLEQDGQRPDVLHLHWLGPYLKGRGTIAKALYAVKLLLDVALVRRAGVRLVWTVHNLVGHEQTHPRLELWLRRRLARRADALIVHSPRAAAMVSESYRIAQSRLTVIPHGHYRDVYGPPLPMAEARARLGLPREGRVFLFFGMIRPYKGVLPLVAAWAGAPELHAQGVLVIAGEARDADYRAEVIAAAEGVPNLRLMLGRVPDAEVAALFSAADVVVLLFERALTSGTLVLAQSYGRVIVTTSPLDGTRKTRSVAPDGAAAGLADEMQMVARCASESPPASVPGWPTVARLHATVFGPRP